MSAIGADVSQLRSTAIRFNEAADRLDMSLRAVNARIADHGTWVGADAQRFRVEWENQSIGALHAAVTLLRSAADSLRLNADEQESASRVEGAGLPDGDAASGSSGAAKPLHESPDGVEGMWDTIKGIPPGDGTSGYRVEKVLGPDGEYRYIVYIVGNNGSETQSGMASNVNAAAGRLDEAQVAQLEKLIPKDAEVMLVGYSQGGMDAQNIAVSGRLNVTQVVAFGSPARGDLDVPIIHLRAAGDPVPMSPALLNAGPYRLSMFQPETDDITFFDAGSGRDFWDLNGHHQSYGGVAAQYDKAVADGSESAQAHINDFRGAVYESTDLAHLLPKASGGGGW